MPHNDREIWDDIVAGPGITELQYLTYAIYSFEKFEWYEQFEKQKGIAPTSKEIDEWISQITAIRIKTWRESAAAIFDKTARVYLKDEMDKERQKIANDSVTATVRDHLAEFKSDLQRNTATLEKSSSFKTTLTAALITAIITPIILGVLILAIQAADLWPTPTQIQKFFNREAPEHQSPGSAPKS
jgi:hypothetical protein